MSAAKKNKNVLLADTVWDARSETRAVKNMLSKVENETRDSIASVKENHMNKFVLLLADHEVSQCTYHFITYFSSVCANVFLF